MGRGDQRSVVGKNLDFGHGGTLGLKLSGKKEKREGVEEGGAWGGRRKRNKAMEGERETAILNQVI